MTLTLGFLLQTLNVGIFRAIGHVGVYYGFKLGHQVRMHCVHTQPLHLGVWAYSRFGYSA